MTSQATDTAKALRALADADTLKVWSLLVTVLGDLGAGPQKELSGPWLKQLFAKIGISPEALRVALHRLRKDDWIVTRKVGRISYYALSEKGARQTSTVWDRVYADSPETSPAWSICFCDPANPSDLQGAIKLSPSVIAVIGARPDTLVFNLDQQALPDWIERLPVFDSITSLAREVTSVLKTVAVQDMRANTIDALAFRLLVLHNWRRLALKDASWFHMRHVPDSAVLECFRHVRTVLDTIPAPDASLAA